MNPIEVIHVAKAFGTTQAVKDVSFNVKQGEIFGLLGPNGAGKTTTIRMVLDVFKPDTGEITVLGGAINTAAKDRIGYMPEDRGLYQEISLESCLLYMAKLKSVPTAEARKRLDDLLNRFDLADHKNKKVKALSKGMQQKAQIINTILHQPDLIIIDEPFTALDPLNVNLVRNLIRELRDTGTTIIMSTHQMHQVEELCDRILLINNGVDVLYGNLNKIRRDFSGNAVLVQTPDELPQLDTVVESSRHNGTYKLTLAPDAQPQNVLNSLVGMNVRLEKFEVAVPSLDEIFIRVVQEGGRNE